MLPCPCMKTLRHFLTGLALLAPALTQAESPIDFQRDIRPILSDRCIACHGPDEEHRKAKLRLDIESEAKMEAIVAGNAEASEVFLRIISDDPDDVMPPPKMGKGLNAEETELIRRWINEGANYEAHWAFQAPVRPELPEVRQSDWVRNPIDTFILSRLEAEGLAPSPEADPATLQRRLSFDLTGLPPVAFEKAMSVDDLLASPAYGERWARKWLDAARYADSSGFEKDKPREVWFYRDWVIHAFNRDLPYDRFIIEQIAGDLLPDASQDQHVATGYLRNSMVNEEGGIDPEQFRMEAMFDRMDAIGKGVLGITVQCSQCHTHKFDPLTQTEYYEMFAFLNNSSEGSMAVYSPEELKQRESIVSRVREFESKLRKEHPGWKQEMAAWERKVTSKSLPKWEVLALDPLDSAAGGQKFLLQPDGSYLAQGYQPTKTSPLFRTQSKLARITALQVELLTDGNLPRNGPGRSKLGTAALTEFRVNARPISSKDKPAAQKIASATADLSLPKFPLPDLFHDKSDKKRFLGPIDFAIDGDQLTAWSTDAGPGIRNVSRKAVFTFETPIENEGGSHLEIILEQRHGGWNNNADMSHGLGRFRISATGEPAVSADPVPREVREIFAIPAAKRSPQQVDTVFRYWRTTIPEFSETNEAIAELWKQHPEGVSQLVLAELPSPRSTHLLHRGDFLSKEEQVQPATPAFLHPLPEDAPRTRLTFARWLVDRDSPTTARALVNRVWQSYFGTGITRTSEDLGLQGEMPTHPELLDWLAVEFMENGWSLKHLHRLITDSATYRQSSVVSPERQERDPDNRLLARGPRFRLESEAIRDNALAISGLLHQKVGGPSVYPPAPAELFVPPASYGYKTWVVAEGPDRYRRALYTFQYRSSPYPGQQVFDAPTGELSCVQRNRSNTPLQALTTLNEPLFVECARNLAKTGLADGGGSDEEILTFLFQRCVSRGPLPREQAVLLDLLSKQHSRIASGEIDSNQLASLSAEDLDSEELAAWTVVARTLLNLDETITKE